PALAQIGRITTDIIQQHIAWPWQVDDLLFHLDPHDRHPAPGRDRHPRAHHHREHVKTPHQRRTWAAGGDGYHAADVVSLLNRYERLGFETEANPLVDALQPCSSEPGSPAAS